MSSPGCDEINVEVTFLHVPCLCQFSVFLLYSFICTVEKLLDFPCGIVSLKFHDEILPAM